MTTEERRTDLAARTLAAWGPEKQRLACAEECSELAAELLRDTRGRSSDLRIAEELAGVLQTCESLRLTLDPETFAAAELAQADKLEAKLEADAAPAPEVNPSPNRSGETAKLMARILWDNLSTSQQAAMRAAIKDSRGNRKLKYDTRNDTTQALRHAKCIERRASTLTPMGLAVREAGMGR